MENENKAVEIPVEFVTIKKSATAVTFETNMTPYSAVGVITVALISRIFQLAGIVQTPVYTPDIKKALPGAKEEKPVESAGEVKKEGETK